MKFYLLEKNRNLHQPIVSTNHGDRSEHAKLLFTVPYAKLNMLVGLPKIVQIEAGKEFVTIIEVDAPRSIISIMF